MENEWVRPVSSDCRGTNQLAQDSTIFLLSHKNVGTRRWLMYVVYISLRWLCKTNCVSLRVLWIFRTYIYAFGLSSRQYAKQCQFVAVSRPTWYLAMSPESREATYRSLVLLLHGSRPNRIDFLHLNYGLVFFQQSRSPILYVYFFPNLLGRSRTHFL